MYTEGMMKILIVDDEQPIRELIAYNLKKAEYETCEAEDGVHALVRARSEKPSLIILDLMLPDMSGLDVCRVLRHDDETSSIPIIMVTAKTEDSDIVAGLELGADDYVTKPFSPGVLTARINSVLRRVQTQNEKNNGTGDIAIRNIVINPVKHAVTVDDTTVDLSATEFALLEFLARHAGQVFSRRQLINAVKGDSYPVTERAIDVQILGLRKKIGDKAESADSQIIETIRGVGYRMKEN